ncbi:hypothetical protein DNAM5_75 [Haloarcula californiae tailed virus 1]|uniref:Uncharacterized protein n=1 Tax=Haloarcula californiae tailed virus 1 TaxID=1273746 RepID=R4THZ8_9CAUD|nr:hypothetical protein M202_gp142 [Haloarcula californiae tailed virus 1]AGM11936.1 hypothetical protein DNAM5_75 [Haloarcula californiae tailed virus 1]
MSDADDDADAVEGVPEATPGADELHGDDASDDGDDDAEERPITVEFTRAEAIVLLHVAWDKEIELSEKPQTAGLAQLVSGIGLQVGKEVYSEQMTEWLKEQQEQKEDMMEQLQDQMGGMFDGNGQNNTGPLGFQ